MTLHVTAPLLHVFLTIPISGSHPDGTAGAVGFATSW